MTAEELSLYGRVYGILAGIRELSTVEINTASFRPVSSLKKAIERRASKMTPEDHERIAALLAGVSETATEPVKEEDTGPFWIAFYKQVGAGRPPKYGEPMTTRTIRVPDRLWKQASEKAAENNNTVSDVIRDALEAYIK